MFPPSSKTATRRTALIMLACACLIALSLAPARAEASSNADVKRAMTALSGGAGAYAWNITDGQGVAARNAGTGRIIASNAKLFTAAAILSRYGTGGRFSTGVHTAGTLTAGTLTGDLYLRGGGDPLFGNASFVTTNFGSGATLEKLAQGLKSAGVRTVTGTIYGDESVFDSRRGTVYSGFSRSSDIGGSLGGLMVNKGFVNGRWQANPPAFAAQRLRAALQGVGIRVTSRTGIARTPAGAKRLAWVRSLPTSALVRQMNKPSNNYLAEMLAKALAMPVSAADDDDDGGQVPLGNSSATTASGNSVSRRHAAGFGSMVRLADGSGLSRSDNAAPREVVDLLRGVHKTVAFTDFKASLPIAGVDGTLASRMRRGSAYRNCFAKTGTLSNVSTLSGYCTTAGGDLVAFSILQNRVAPAAARAQQDRVAAQIAALD
ncbi:MAG: D-alanyl-D-alanine carboxypeptidase/D-alanyl-D-alanine-endopeptidase [Thermoleophilaceae bacterium]|nr:D-alanyl-D-alanine carboxypeptidase/D-alanyl-D-alanine-endopeptidase [Thermoleophilaceae bacterium]